jgi:hypothetical protein
MGTGKGVAAVAGEARETIDGLLDELKQTIAEKLSAEDLAAFVAGRVAIMATIRMERRGLVPESQAAAWAHPREDATGGAT